MIALYLIRHAQTKQLAGVEATHPRNDSGLSQRGTEQARALAAFLSDKPLDLVLTSLFLRTQQTAVAILAGRDVPTFASMALNEYQLRDDSSGVESTDLAAARGLGYLYQFAPYYENIAIVSHNALLSTLRMRLMNLPFNAATNAFSAEGAFRLLRYDCKRGDENWREECYFDPGSVESSQF
jgi:broad specificity phosphatase PhoE